MRTSSLILWMAILLTIPFASFAQSKTITGKVTNQSNDPIPLATIQQKGSTNAVTSDENGMFSINLTGNNPAILVSSVNYTTREISVGNRITINVELQGSGELSEVIVTALGITRQKRSLGYSAQGVGAVELAESHQSNLVNALQGKVAGVTITSSGGGPGQGANILIRGVNSLTLGTQPLFVIFWRIDNNFHLHVVVRRTTNFITQQ